MEPQYSGGGPQKSREKEGSPSIKLGLGIGADSGQNPVITKQGKKKRVVFTQAQLHELQQQNLIFKYMVARIPVPVQLVIPIWTSVASSFGSSNGGIYKQYPSFVGFCPEAGRCRRTDGKKWRCSKDVVPDQKYCERHMHRGRKRSRKLVEASEIAPPLDTTPPNNSNNNSENSESISTPASCQLMTPFSSNTIASHRNPTTITTIGSNDGIAISPTAAIPTLTTSTISTTPTAIAANTTTSTLTMSTSSSTPTTSNISTTPTPTNHNSDSRTNHNLDGKAVNQSSKNRSNMNIRGNISPGLDFSPKSVLQEQGCSGSCFYRSDIELEPGRCRRTDGKKWRCSRDVVPEQKYCAQHMHRGAKRHVEASQPVAVPNAARPYTKNVPNAANYATPNTNLSISIPACPQLVTNDEKSTNSSGSDTTITDTTITAYEIGNFSS